CKMLGLSLLYLLVSSVCLRLSPGIIAENMANLPLIGAACILIYANSSFVAWAVSILCMALACLIKPTAALPGLGLVCSQLWWRTRVLKTPASRDIIQIIIWTLVFVSILVGLYWLNAWDVQHYFWRSAVIYNAS